MGKTIAIVHNCGYPLMREEAVDAVDVRHGLHLSSELQATLIRDQYTERCYSLLSLRFSHCAKSWVIYWYDGTPDMDDAELAQHVVKQCPKCGAALALGEK